MKWLSQASVKEISVPAFIADVVEFDCTSHVWKIYTTLGLKNGCA